MNNFEQRPKEILTAIGKKWPQAWNQVKKFRAGKGKDLPNWPDWCYLPLAAGYAIVTQGGAPNAGLFDRYLGPAVVSAAAAWRVSQGIYVFDADLYNSLVKQPMDGNIPCEILKRLPEWCVYIPMFNGTFLGEEVDGFFAHLEHDANDARMELRLVLLMASGENHPIPIHLGDWTIEEGLNRMITEARRQMGINFPKVDESYVAEVVPFVQLVLYLCAENLDMPKRPQHPKKKLRKSGQVDVPRQPKKWDVGQRIGTSIRKYRNTKEYEITDENQNNAPGSHASPRPHVRRAHWHSFWTGPREGNRKLIVRWLPPIPIGVDDEDNPTVIHEVKE